MVREGYHLNELLKEQLKGREIPIFHATDPDLRGGRRLRAGWRVDWAMFVPTESGQTQKAGRIDVHLARPLGNIPRLDGGFANLALADLDLGQDVGLPSGQTLAQALGIRNVLPPRTIDLPGLPDHETPLWYYILREAELQQQGYRLGLLGSEIVGEVLVGIIQMDPLSYLSRHPGWLPTFSSGGDFTLTDLLEFAYRPLPGGATRPPTKEPVT
jgi:hypothetical protein